jgi:hypothetical protein
VYIAVAVRATGWLGFGLAEAGGMLGADMALFTPIRPTEIIDAYTLEGRRPITDNCQQDGNWSMRLWILFWGKSTRCLYYGSGQGAAVYLSVDDEIVYIAVAVRATGWLGFGLAEFIVRFNII